MNAVKAYVVAHWRGELSLPRSFLLNGLLVYFALVFGLVGLGWIFPSKAFLYGALAFFAVWEIWAVVGIARCTFRVYREPLPTFGRLAAQRAFAVLVIVVTAAFVYSTLADLRMFLGSRRTTITATIHG